MEKETKEIADEFKDFAYIVSHDLGAPVRGMVEFSKLLEKSAAEKLDEDEKEFLYFIINSGKKMQEMMRSLLEYSRVNTCENQYSILDVNEVVEECKSRLQDKIRATSAVFEVGPLPKIYGDANQVAQLFSVLIDNAIKFQAKDNIPKIKIDATQEDGHVRLGFTDNGIGINERFSEKIYKLFQRLHSEEEYAGVGIGLTLAKKIMSRHNGKIWFESDGNMGSAFYVTFPINDAIE